MVFLLLTVLKQLETMNSSENLKMMERVEAANEFNTLMDEFEKEQAGFTNDGDQGEQFDIQGFFKSMPRKMRRKMLAQNSFSNRFKRNMINKV